jgi:beta-glucosidase
MYRTEDTSGAELPEPGPVSVVGKLTWTLPEQDSFPEAVEAAAKSDVAIVFASTQGTDGEGRDRPSLTLPGNQDQLIDLVAHANKNTIVVLNTGTPCQLTAWLSDVPAVIDMGFPGEQGGNAVASILFGETVPSGKLVDTWGASRQDYPDYGNFPGTDGTVNYAEGIYVGYRYFDKNGITPVFPFGYGLSYTTFAYSDLRLSDTTLSPHGTLTAQVNVTNTGSRAGSEIVELYLHSAASRTDRPVRELKGFERIQLAPGEKGSVSFTVSPRDLCYYDAAGVRFRADRGPYEVQIGASARDIRETAGFELTGDYTASP